MFTIMLFLYDGGMENRKSISSNVPDIGTSESDQEHYERRTQEAHRIAERLMAEHFGPRRQKEAAQE